MAPTDDRNGDGVPSVWDAVQDDRTSRISRDEPRQATILVIAGLDPSGGAGLLADTRVVLSHGFHIAGVVTALTEQDSTQCAWMHPVSAEIVQNQLARLIDDCEIRGVKVGVLATAEVATAVAKVLRRLVDAKVPIVVDPVLRATRGVPLLEASSARTALAPVLEMSTLVTPNIEELAQLTQRHVGDFEEMRDAAYRLRGGGRFGGPHAVLAKGGHLPGDPVDVLVDKEGDIQIKGERLEGVTPHGTGCALSSEIACRLALSTPIREAVVAATDKVRTMIAEARSVGRGRPFLG
jgi:hydroxymethylpyrimidine/phosphomethylpyrimidine kinase